MTLVKSTIKSICEFVPLALLAVMGHVQASQPPTLPDPGQILQKPQKVDDDKHVETEEGEKTALLLFASNSCLVTALGTFSICTRSSDFLS